MIEKNQDYAVEIPQKKHAKTTFPSVKKPCHLSPLGTQISCHTQVINFNLDFPRPSLHRALKHVLMVTAVQPKQLLLHRVATSSVLRWWDGIGWWWGFLDIYFLCRGGMGWDGMGWNDDGFFFTVFRKDMKWGEHMRTFEQVHVKSKESWLAIQELHLYIVLNSYGDEGYKLDVHRTPWDPRCVNCKQYVCCLFCISKYVMYIYINIFQHQTWTSSYYNFRPPGVKQIMVSSTLGRHIFLKRFHGSTDPNRIPSNKPGVCCISERGGKGKPTLSPLTFKLTPKEKKRIWWFSDFGPKWGGGRMRTWINVREFCFFLSLENKNTKGNVRDMPYWWKWWKTNKVVVCFLLCLFVAWWIFFVLRWVFWLWFYDLICGCVWWVLLEFCPSQTTGLGLG